MRLLRTLLCMTLIAPTLAIAATQAKSMNPQVAKDQSQAAEAFQQLTDSLCHSIYHHKNVADNLNNSGFTFKTCPKRIQPILIQLQQTLLVKLNKQYGNQLPDDPKLRMAIGHELAQAAIQSYLVRYLTVSRSSYLKLFQQRGGMLICGNLLRDNPNQMKGLSATQCLKKIEPVMSQCVKQYTPKIPKNLHRQDIVIAGHVLNDCTKAHFLKLLSHHK